MPHYNTRDEARSAHRGEYRQAAGVADEDGRNLRRSATSQPASDLVINVSVHLLIPVSISPPEMGGIFNSFVRRAAARLGVLMYGVMRALIARWLALIAMLGLLALVIATSRIPCVPYGLWPTLQMHCR
jgi:hypothetical protein